MKLQKSLDDMLNNFDDMPNSLDNSKTEYKMESYLSEKRLIINFLQKVLKGDFLFFDKTTI